MNSVSKAHPLAITQAKKTSADGKVTYYFSKPKVKLFDIKGRLWVRRRIKQLKRERTL